MGKVLVVFKREFVERVRSKWFIVATVLGPILFAAIVIIPNVMAAKTRTSERFSDVVVIDATGSDLGARVAKALASTTPMAPEPRLRAVRVEQVAAEEERATQEVMRNEALGYLVLDSNTTGGKEVRYAGRNATALKDISDVEQLVRRSVLAQRLEREGINPERVSMLTSVRIDAKTEKISDKGKEGASGLASFLFAYVIALLLYMMIAIYGQSIMRGVLEEKTTRVAEVVVSSVKPDTLLGGKIIGVAMVAITQMVVWIVMAFLIIQVRAPIFKALGAPPDAAASFKVPSVDLWIGVALFLFFVLGFLFYAALFGAVGAMVSNQEDIQQAATPVMLLLIASIVFIQPILLNPTSTFAVVMSMLPFSAPVIMPLRLALVAIPAFELVASMLSVAIGCWLAIWVSARIYRVGLLMYGKRPSMRELAHWIRMA